LLNGTATNATLLERELILLIRKSYGHPTRLSPSDLDPIRGLVGDGFLDYVQVLETFTYMNRIAGLLNVSHEVLPPPLRRFDLLRKTMVHLSGRFIATGNLANRAYGVTYEQALSSIRSIFVRATGKEPENELELLRTRPKLVEVFQMHLEERDIRSSLDRDTVTKIHHTVETTLLDGAGGSEGHHNQSKAPYDHLGDPVEHYVAVGTRFAYRTTPAMIDALRREGYDDLGLLDLATAVADANKWARTYRLLDLDPNLLYIRHG
jgi:hypothetical protein